MTQDAKWRITFPVTKAESRNGRLFLTGEATGPEVDATRERMDPIAIEGFQRQITQAVAEGNPLPYRDAHAKDGVLRDLGTLSKAWLKPNGHLGVEVELDSDNPAAVYLYQQVHKGKQFGMSVFGYVKDYADEWVTAVGHVVRTFKSVVLDEISNTTKPAWTPSFGTVLSKAIDDAAAESVAKNGESTSMDEELQPAQETIAPAAEVEETTEKAEVPEAVETVVEQTAPDESTETTEKAAEDAETEQVVEKAGRVISASTANTLMSAHADLMSSMARFGESLAALGVLDPEDVPSSFDESGQVAISDDNDITAEKSVSEDTESTVEKSAAPDEADLRTQVAELQKSLAEQAAVIAELRTKPSSGRPVLIAKSADEVMDPMAAIAAMTPGERLRLGLAARHPGEPR